MSSLLKQILVRAGSHGAACALGVVLIGTQFGNGCVSTPSEPADDRYPYPDSSSDSDREDYRIPSDARLVKEGVGELTFRAGSNGRMWIYDEKDRKTVYFVDLLDGDDVSVDAKEDRVYINRRSVAKLSLSSERVYRLYFDGRRSWSNRPDRPDYDRPDYNRPDYNRPDRPEKPVARPVPDTAKLVAESKSGGDLAYRAQGNGTLYLWDNSNNVLIETFNLRKGQRLLVSPSKDVATLDGKTVMQRKGISKRANYRLLFDVKD